MTNKNTATTAKPAKFKWNDDNRASVTARYLEQVALDHETANSEKFLGSLATEVGALSARAVRSMLATEKVYQTLDAAPRASTSNRISKGQIVRSIAKGMDLDLEVVQTLEKANAEALTTLVSAINSMREAAGQSPIEIK